MSSKQGEDPEMSKSRSVEYGEYSVRIPRYFISQDEEAMYFDEYDEFNEFDRDFSRDFYTDPEMEMYRNFFSACKSGNVDRLKKINCSLNSSQHYRAAIYAVKNKQREVYIFLLQKARDADALDQEWGELGEGEYEIERRDSILIGTANHFANKNDLETIEWLVSGELNPVDATQICNEVLYEAACNKNVSLEDWVLNKYAHYVDVTHENHRTLRSVIFPMHHESIERLCEEYIKHGKEKISFEVIINEAIEHMHVALLKLVIESWAEGFDVREMKVNSKMDPACYEYLKCAIELQNAVGIEKWKESLKAKEVLDSKLTKPRQW